MKSIEERLKEFVEHLDKVIDDEYDKLPLSQEDAIRKNAYCLALEKDKNAILNILSGYDYYHIDD